MKTIQWLSALMALFSFVDFVDAEIIIPPPGLEPGDQYRLILTTSQRRDATSSDINVYNDFVQSVADSSPELGALELDWRALGSTNDVNSRDNTNTNFSEENSGLPIYRVDGQLWSPNYFFQASGPTFSLLDVDEFGSQITEFETNSFGEDAIFVWTGAGGSRSRLGERIVRAGNALAFRPVLRGLFRQRARYRKRP